MTATYSCCNKGSWLSDVTGDTGSRYWLDSDDDLTFYLQGRALIVNNLASTITLTKFVLPKQNCPSYAIIDNQENDVLQILNAPLTC